jgi:hypothetical protein
MLHVVTAEQEVDGAPAIHESLSISQVQRAPTLIALRDTDSGPELAKIEASTAIFHTIGGVCRLRRQDGQENQELVDFTREIQVSRAATYLK